MITIDKKNKVFYINTKNLSYIIHVNKFNKQLEKIYFGKKISSREGMNESVPFLERAFSTYTSNLKNISLESRPLEFSTTGFSDYKNSSAEFAIDKNCLFHFTYKKYKIEKYNESKILPNAYNGKDTLVLIIEDVPKKILLEIRYTPFYESNVIVKNFKIINHNNKELVLTKMLSTNVDFLNPKKFVMTLDGSWARERKINISKLENNLFQVSSKEGITSATHQPFLALLDKNTSENFGEVYGASLIYSSNFEVNYEINQLKIGRLSMGINSDTFEWKLKRDEHFETPQAVLTFSDKGFNGMSQNFHYFIKNHISPKKWSFKERPIILNNWEATYFDFDEKKVLELAKQAKKIGIELFCLDDGWFGERNNDESSLGDWYSNKEKLPNGINNLSKQVNDVGLKFGIWIEPEMISENSKLFREHPNWAIYDKKYPVVRGRNQLILDLTNKDVIDYLDKTFTNLFNSANIEYVKWDMNRAFGHSPYKGFEHKYTLGLYKLLNSITKKFPHILFEGCSAGGGRFDMGVLKYFPQIWTSDNTDAFERTKIQCGTSIIYPLNTISNHVSSSPNHQTKRSIDLKTRQEVAHFGILGYELDLTKQNQNNLNLIKKYINEYKQIRKDLLHSSFYRIKNPFKNNIFGWQTISKNKERVIVFIFKSLEKINTSFNVIKLQNLDKNQLYKIRGKNYHIEGRELIYKGLIPTLDIEKGDFKSLIYLLEKI